jgi:hypothetical protein
MLLFVSISRFSTHFILIVKLKKVLIIFTVYPILQKLWESFNTMLNEATEIHDAEEGFLFFLMKTLSFLICCLIPNIALSRGMDFSAYISQFKRAGDGATLKKEILLSIRSSLKQYLE